MRWKRQELTLVEIGIPFSDPIAEGPVIQEANIRSLSGGCTTDKIFDMVSSLRKKNGYTSCIYGVRKLHFTSTVMRDFVQNVRR